MSSIRIKFDYGLIPSGSKLGNGVKLKTPPGHIPLNVEIDGYKNWLKAIFVSPSIFYSGNPCNSDWINSSNKRYYLLMKQEFKRSFSRHNSTVLKHVPVDDERSKVKYKIEVKFILVQ